MVCISIYDTKVVAILSTACTRLTWRGKTRKNFDNGAGINVLMKYLKSEVIDDYNHGMNSIDQADTGCIKGSGGGPSEGREFKSCW